MPPALASVMDQTNTIGSNSPPTTPKPIQMILWHEVATVFPFTTPIYIRAIKET